MYFSQFREDKYLNDYVFHGKKSGVYVELGNLESVRYSNTRFFKDTLNWTGLSMNPQMHKFIGLNDNKLYENAIDKSIKPITLSSIVRDSGFKHIDLLSLDVKDYGLEALNSWDFLIPIDVILIGTLGAQSERDQKCRDILLNNKYKFFSKIKHSEIYVLDSFSVVNNVREVNSFDIFDTLITRLVQDPIEVFDYVEKKYNIGNFKIARLQSQHMSNHTFDNIYDNMKKITGLNSDQIELLKNFEITAELDNLIPIKCNIDLVQDGDILVSDMYLPEEILERIVRSCGLSKKVSIYVSPSGKSNGSVWSKLNEIYNIRSHLGDNLHSDIDMARNYGIHAVHTMAHQFSEFEKLIYNTDLLPFFRKFKLLNPYRESTYEYKLYKEQAEINIPLLCFIISKILDILNTENRDTVLFITRDCCLLQKIFEAYYPQYKSIKFHSSRVINNSYNEDYRNYVKQIYNHEKCLIVDLHGSFNSGRKLFLDLFNQLPRIYIFDYSKQSSEFETLTYSTSISNNIESYNVDTVGTMVNFEKTLDIRAPAENSIRLVRVIHDTILQFIDYGKGHNFSKIIDNQIFKNSRLLIEFYSRVASIKPLLLNQFDHLSLTNIANLYNTDKGNVYKCAHHYTRTYEKVISKLNTKSDKVKLLEIGLNRDNSLDIPSLRMWDRYFNNNVKLYGFDINPDFKNFQRNNIKIYIGDQSKAEDLLQLKNRNYDMIIDDGYHASKHQQISFKTLWDNVANGGFYIIEDLHYQPELEFELKTKDLFINWKNNNYISSNYISESEVRRIAKTIDSIEFSDSYSKNWDSSILKNALVVIRKKNNPKNILRLGFTEMTLLLIWYSENILNIKNNDFRESQRQYLGFLHTTSGYYDNSNVASYMEVDYDNYNYTVYNQYMKRVLDTLRNADHLEFNIHNFFNEKLVDNFKAYLNFTSDGFIDRKMVYDFIRGKKILIISSFSELIKHQIESGNCNKIFKDFPDIQSIHVYTPYYTFFNKGPHGNILETLDSIVNDIKNLNYDYDSVLISCGAYSVLLAHEFIEMGKKVCLVGGFLQPYFGIYNNRIKVSTVDHERINDNDITDTTKQYWIYDIPDKYKPENYKLIEDGCYW